MQSIKGKVLYTILFIINTLISIDCTSLPSFIKPCSLSDPKRDVCIKNTAQAALKRFSMGIPELDVPTLDPAKLNRIPISVPGLKIVYDNTILTGIGDGKLDHFKLDWEKSTLKLEYFGNVTLRGKYKINGRFLILPVVGDGDYINIIKGLKLVIKYNFKVVKLNDGKEHWVMELAKRSFKVQGASFDFKNLFNGNKLLAQTTLTFINNNWEIIMNEIAPPAIDQIMYVCLKAANKFYEKVPISELLLP